MFVCQQKKRFKVSTSLICHIVVCGMYRRRHEVREAVHCVALSVFITFVSGWLRIFPNRGAAEEIDATCYRSIRRELSGALVPASGGEVEVELFEDGGALSVVGEVQLGHHHCRLGFYLAAREHVRVCCERKAI